MGGSNAFQSHQEIVTQEQHDEQEAKLQPVSRCAYLFFAIPVHTHLRP